MIVTCARCERDIPGEDDCCPFCGFDPLCDPTKFGPFDLIEVRGRGAMSVVFKATKRGELVALKVLESTDPKILEQFDREGEVVMDLSHPNLVEVYEAGEADEHGYLAMEFVDGPSLRQAIRRRAFTQSGFADIIASVARAMVLAHKAGVVHRDLTPGNILLTQAGDPKVVDFGLALRLEEAGKLVAGVTAGTPVYMSPEQAAGLHDVIDSRADIYSLGAVLFEAVTGKAPFQGTGVLDILRKVQSDEPVMTGDVDPGLAAIIKKSMAKDMSRRYQSMRDFAEALKAWTASKK